MSRFATMDPLTGQWVEVDQSAVHVALLCPNVPTVEELDTLTADISACGYASEAVEVVETWTRKKWDVVSAITTQFEEERK
ncbi:MAG: hypothetical protein ACOYB2_19705 [Limnohabitans sp.]